MRFFHFAINLFLIHTVVNGFTLHAIVRLPNDVVHHSDVTSFPHFKRQKAIPTLLCNSATSSNTYNYDDLERKLNVTGVTVKMAFDTTYAVADASEEKSERFTCPLSLDLVHKLRRWSDAVLVGRGTVQRDDCTLTVRRVPLLCDGKLQPARVVLDPQLKIMNHDYDYALLKDGHRTLIYHSTDNDDELSLQLKTNANVSINKVTSVGKGELEGSAMSATQILNDLYSKNIRHVMVEGGPMTAIQFLNEKVVDRAILIRAPVTFIEPVPSGMSNEMFVKAGLELLKTQKCGDDMVEYWIRKGESWPSSPDFESEMWPY